MKNDGVANRRASALSPIEKLANAEIAAAQSGRQTRGFEDEILRAEGRVPGVGGIFLGRSGKAVVYLKDTIAKTVALQSLRTAAASMNVDPGFRAKIGSEESTEIRLGKFSFSELVAYQKLIIVHRRDLGLVSLDADEALNRLRIDVTNEADTSRILAAAVSYGIPESAIAFEVGSLPVSQSTLRDRVRPAVGGMQIVIGNLRCTLGFNVIVQFYNEYGFLTASHCKDHGSGTTGTTVYQNTGGGSNIAGIVSINPAWNSTDPACGTYTLCTDADVLYAHSWDSTSVTWARWIAHVTVYDSTNGAGTITINGHTSGYTVNPYVYVGQQAWKVGRTTGGTVGTVATTCESPVVDSLTATPYVAICSDRVDNGSSGGGDSGAPVHQPPNTGYAMGILFAGSGATFFHDNGDNTDTCTSVCKYYFSDWNAIQIHLSRYLTP
ncbi:MAG: hypothetical protein ABJC26_00055 [Gemmatimonadaceae bacterium]